MRTITSEMVGNASVALIALMLLVKYVMQVGALENFNSRFF